jgi:carbamoyltransferase
MRIGPRHPLLGALSFRIALPIFEGFYRRRAIHRADSAFARARIGEIADKIASGGTAYLAGISAAGTHNSGVALIEVTREHGPRLLFNNEEERFSGVKHSNAFPKLSIIAMQEALARMGLSVECIDAWFSAWDYPAFNATLIRTVCEEVPQSLGMLRPGGTPLFRLRDLDRGVRAARHLGRMFESELGSDTPVPLIATPHHENHAWFSFATSPFANREGPTLVAVLDGVGDMAAISIYRCEDGQMWRLYTNDSVFDSLGIYYAVISSTQGGWTWLSSEGRYMGAAAFGDMDRSSNPYYPALKSIFSLQSDGRVYLNRDLANWPRDIQNKPYTQALIDILGEPIAQKDLWNPDAVLRLEDIKHKEATQARLDKAAAAQLVFEDVLIHVIDHWIRKTGSDRLVLTGGTGLNAVGNMRLLEHFGREFYRHDLLRDTQLHLWVPPTPNDAGVTIGAAYMGAYLAGFGVGAPSEHAFYCGLPPAAGEITAALDASPDVERVALVDLNDATRPLFADFMAYMTAQDAIIALYQGAAETGPRALGHRSILANPCNAQTRDNLNARVKFREAIRPLAPMMTLEAALHFFELSDGASDDEYNAYNYMVLTAHAKPEALTHIPAVVHADGTGRLQIVREAADPLTYAYLKALGLRIGVEVTVNTSFNVGGPIAQTPTQALETLRRAKGLDAVLMFSEEGPVFAALHGGTEGDGGTRFRQWLDAWERETGARLRR